MGVDSVADLRDLDPRPVRKAMTVVGKRIIHELRGMVCLPLELMPAQRKGCAVTRSFSRRIEDREPMRFVTTTVTLPEATNDTLALIKAAREGIARTWRETPGERIADSRGPARAESSFVTIIVVLIASWQLFVSKLNAVDKDSGDTFRAECGNGDKDGPPAVLSRMDCIEGFDH